MAIVTTTTLANVLRTVYNPEVLADLVFGNDYLFQLPGAASEDTADGHQAKKPRGLFPVVPSRGGTSYNWPVRQATTAAAAYVQGQAAPAPGNNTYLMASLAYSAGYFWRAVEISGHAVDALRDEGAIIEAIDREVIDAARAMQDLINTTFMGTSHLQLAIDSAGTYAGIDRGTYTNWGSYETNVGGALSVSALADMIEALEDNDRGARHEDLILLCPVNQVTNYGALVGAGAGTPVVTPAGGVADLGFSGYTFQGLPIFGIPDLTDTIWLAVHRPSVKWVLHRPLTISPKSPEGDSDKLLLTCALQMVVERPQLCGKLTGVTA
jgi:hypothetical protein